MALLPGSRLGPYEIQSAIGSGGMGAVYRARDSRLDRTVAIKVLPELFHGDANLRDRFKREARTISQLNHPNVCALHDVGQDQGIDYLVLEFLDGETLEQRIARGPLKLEDTLRIASEIIAGLAAAHRAGIVHRDLKPANIMLTRAGAKLVDFGLAKANDTLLAPLIATSPTAAPLSAVGTILGTVQYMAPEQLEGREADARTDVFALGAVLYEMITGKKAFQGSSHASVIASIMQAQPPPIASVAPLAPVLLAHVVNKCLVKDPDQRWQSVQDLGEPLAWSRELRASGTSAGVRPRWQPVVWAALGLAVVVAVVVGFRLLRAKISVATISAVRFEIVPPGQINNLPVQDRLFAISPDGRFLAFVATTDNSPRLWIRPLDQTQAQMLPGTENATRPFWSPDGQSLGFFEQGKLKRIDLSGGSPRTICDSGTAGGATWNRDGVILFGSSGAPLRRVSAAGGIAEPVTQLTAGQRAHAHPQFLPDGRRFVFTIDGDEAQRGLYLGSLDDQETRRLPLPSSASGAIVANPDSLLFSQQDALMRVRFDPTTALISGQPQTVATISPFNSTGPLAYTVSDTGVLAYLGSTRRSSKLTWVDRSGKAVTTEGIDNSFPFLQLSSDGRRVAVQRDDTILLVDVGLGTTSRVATGMGASQPVWAPDNKRIAFSTIFSSRGSAIMIQSLSDVSASETLVDSPRQKSPLDWSAGRLLYQELDPETRGDLWIVSLTGVRTPVPVVRTPAAEAAGQFSHDGNWIAYESDESGLPEIYVKPLNFEGRAQQVSTGGGTRPRWRSDDRELFYLSADAHLVAVPMTLRPDGRGLDVGKPEALFATRLAYGTNSGMSVPNYAVAPNGQRFVMSVLPDLMPSPITVLVNWRAAMEAGRPTP